MITVKDIEKLADLARINVSADEKEQLVKEIDSILGYVTQIEKAVLSINTKNEAAVGVVKNITRPDVVTHEAGSCTETILAEAPSRVGDFIAVQKIIAQD